MALAEQKQAKVGIVSGSSFAKHFPQKFLSSFFIGLTKNYHHGDKKLSLARQKFVTPMTNQFVCAVKCRAAMPRKQKKCTIFAP